MENELKALLEKAQSLIGHCYQYIGMKCPAGDKEAIEIMDGCCKVQQEIDDELQKVPRGGVMSDELDRLSASLEDSRLKTLAVLDSLERLAVSQKDQFTIDAVSKIRGRISVLRPAPLRVLEYTLKPLMHGVVTGPEGDKKFVPTGCDLEIRQHFPPELAGKRCKITIELVEE